MRKSLSPVNARVSPGTVIACVALFISLGTSAYAGIALQKNSVRSKHIRNGAVKRVDIRTNAVNSSRVANRSLRARDFRRGQLPQGPPGRDGAAGVPGPAGAPGAAKAYAYVNADATVDASRSKGVTARRGGRFQPFPGPGFVPADGTYCLDIEPAVANGVATAAEERRMTAVIMPASFFVCLGGADAAIVVTDSDGTRVDTPFLVALN